MRVYTLVLARYLFKVSRYLVIFFRGLTERTWAFIQVDWISFYSPTFPSSFLLTRDKLNIREGAECLRQKIVETIRNERLETHKERERERERERRVILTRKESARWLKNISAERNIAGRRIRTIPRVSRTRDGRETSVPRVVIG